MEAFATRCPHCQTGFRVTQAQLDLRGGQVRCGVCRNSFDAVAQRFDHVTSTASLTVASPAAALPADLPSLSTSIEAATSAASGNAPEAPIVSVDFTLSDEPSRTPAGSSMEAELDALSQAIADLRSKPWTEPPAPAEAAVAAQEKSTDADAKRPQEPSLSYDGEVPDAVVLQTTRRRSRSRRVWKVLLWIGIPLLTLSLAIQLIYHFRNDIAARSPQAARQLRSLCAQLGCTIRLPMHLDRLSLAASRLDASPLPVPDTRGEGTEGGVAGKPLLQKMTLVALLRNQGDTAQAWPSIELQLKGADGKVTVRKAFLPAQYLRTDDITGGMSAHSEIEIRIPFELAGEAAADFEATLFYH